MRRSSLSGVIVLVAIVFGCGPGKELPTEVVHPNEQSGPGADPNGTPPAVSDPAAKAILDRAIKSITENDPGRLAKGKVAKVTYQGGIKTAPQGSELTKCSRTIETIWPGFALVTADFKGDFPNVTFYLREQQGWMKLGSQLDTATSPIEVARVMRDDLSAWHWLMLGLPFSDPNAVVFEPAKQAGATIVKVALPGRPIYVVTFDEVTGLPVKTDYRPLENRVRVRKIFTMSEHKLAAGLLLPTKVELTQNDVLVERWSEPVWEFPETIDPSRFEQPKQ